MLHDFPDKIRAYEFLLKEREDGRDCAVLQEAGLYVVTTRALARKFRREEANWLDENETD